MWRSVGSVLPEVDGTVDHVGELFARVAVGRKLERGRQFHEARDDLEVGSFEEVATQIGEARGGSVGGAHSGSLLVDDVRRPRSMPLLDEPNHGIEWVTAHSTHGPRSVDWPPL
jgi:hypothetical protein